MPEKPRQLETAHGIIRFPAYIPVTTFGSKYPLDALIQPYLPRLSQAVMVSHHYAKLMKQRPRLPLLIDSGGFATLFDGSEVFEHRGLGHLRVCLGNEVEVLTPLDVLEFQEEHADVAFTLDFPIPPKLPIAEAKRRQALTIANAVWAIQNRRRRDLRLFACIQAWSVESASLCAAELARHPFDGFAIGGLVPRARDVDLVLAIVAAVREKIDDRPLHVFGLGKPETTARLFNAGVDSVDSSSYVKLAADGCLWENTNFRLQDPSPADRLRLAIQNLATATRTALPLATQAF
ncbi:MAG: tRNA-guanine family transglycosylase [Chthoniobacteraceae bacterium]|nr:tRNA-guanine family transglycosylase [Chthoniobacteraceae bacterium]